MLELCVLGSGSRGNAIYLSDGETRILVDAGLSARQIENRLREIGVHARDISAIIVSHEHTDHVGGIPSFVKKTGSACYTNRLTAEGMKNGHVLPELKVFSTGEKFRIGAYSIHPFTVPHDALDPVGFEITNGGKKVCVATDLGHATNLVRQVLKDCDFLVLESNHDENMLLSDIRRPWSLKQRIKSKIGHLSNRDAGRLLAEIASPRLQRVFLAHLSQDCNTPSCAEDTVRHYLEECGMSGVEVTPTHQSRITEVVTIA